MSDQPMAMEDAVALIANLRAELFTAGEKVREANEAQARAEAAVEPLKQRLVEREEKRGLAAAKEQHVSRVERRRAELRAELARLEGAPS